ncbi:thermonuclease family protein [Bacillus sp. T33-2]|uniref:thermonuclease family protein n=1 Tax=Bacillus sp. T33-2 TaxID=2054168 RepID=UPI000C766F1B|nr:thermonuclease family protein [Bacillus sp. T33-2]PLR92006.1 nuclease [Bacillus sp. T33-2]
MKIIKWIFIAFVLLILLSLVIAAPVAVIGFLIFIAGLYLSGRYRSGKSRFSKSRWVMVLGVILTLILGITTLEPADSAKEAVEPKVSDSEKKKEKEQEKADKEKAEAEKKAKEKAKEKAEAEEREQAEKAEQERLAEEKKQEEQSRQEELATTLGLELVTVGRVVDGDTFETSDGRKIRLIGVNTPESTTRHEDYGKDASNYTASKLEGKQVWIQKDVSDTDRYNRLLRVVWLAIPSNDLDENEIRSKMFNADLVLNGYAEPSTYNPDVKYSDYFVKFAREARESNSGLWAFGSEGTTKGDLDTASASNSGSSATSASASGSSAASASPSGPGNPAPSAPAASSGSSQEFYQNCTELRKVYPDGVPADHPAYASKHDRDKDNFACERS